MNSASCVPWDESKPVAIFMIDISLCYDAINEYTVIINVTVCWFW